MKRRLTPFVKTIRLEFMVYLANRQDSAGEIFLRAKINSPFQNHFELLTVIEKLKER